MSVSSVDSHSTSGTDSAPPHSSHYTIRPTASLFPPLPSNDGYDGLSSSKMTTGSASSNANTSNQKNTVSKTFWPQYLCSPSTKSGFLVGWNTTSFTACVATIVSDKPLQQLEEELAQLFLSNPPIVLGTCHTANASLLTSSAEEIAIKKQSENLWISLLIPEIPPYFPVIKSVHSCGYSYHSSLSNQIILYDQPNSNKLQFLSLDPLSFTSRDPDSNAPKNADLNGISLASPISPMLPSMSEWPFLGDLDKEKLLQKFTAHTGTITQQQPAAAARQDLRLILNQINSCYKVRQAVSSRRPLFFVAPILKFIVLLFSKLVFLPGLVLTFLVTSILFVLEYPILNSKSLKDTSALCQQLHLRLNQLALLPKQSILKSTGDAPERGRRYINFYNTIWLILNDIIIGITLGHTLGLNSEAVAEGFWGLIVHWGGEKIRGMIVWLMGWPAGLKLNSELDTFLGELFLWLIGVWGSTSSVFPASLVHSRLPPLSPLSLPSLSVSLSSLTHMHTITHTHQTDSVII